MTFLLLVLGTILIAIFEWNHAFAGMSVADKWTQAFFNATCPRTAGFTSVDLTSLGVQSVLIYIFLMWVGGAAHQNKTQERIAYPPANRLTTDGRI